MQREKKRENKKTGHSRTVGQFQRCNVVVNGTQEGEERLEQKKWSRGNGQEFFKPQIQPKKHKCPQNYTWAHPKESEEQQRKSWRTSGWEWGERHLTWGRTKMFITVDVLSETMQTRWELSEIFKWQKKKTTNTELYI